jgi:hypothetical protein
MKHRAEERLQQPLHPVERLEERGAGVRLG